MIYIQHLVIEALQRTFRENYQFDWEVDVRKPARRFDDMAVVVDIAKMSSRLLMPQTVGISPTALYGSIIAITAYPSLRLPSIETLLVSLQYQSGGDLLAVLMASLPIVLHYQALVPRQLNCRALLKIACPLSAKAKIYYHI